MSTTNKKAPGAINTGGPNTDIKTKRINSPTTGDDSKEFNELRLSFGRNGFVFMRSDARDSRVFYFAMYWGSLAYLAEDLGDARRFLARAIAWEGDVC